MNVADMFVKKFKCGNCDSISTADRINEVTISNCCMNRKQRRMYKPIEKTTDGTWYKCPVCGENIRRRGWQEIRED